MDGHGPAVVECLAEDMFDTMVRDVCRVRRTFHTYTDASGVDRWIAALGRFQENGVFRWVWTRFQAPSDLWDLFFEREDHCIGVQELVGVILAAETFQVSIKGSTWVTWCDNHGVVFSVLAGGNRAMDANLLIAHLWSWIARHDVEFEINAVHTKCTVADGPTRHCPDMVKELDAVWLKACLPEYFMDFWNGPDGADANHFESDWHV